MNYSIKLEDLFKHMASETITVKYIKITIDYEQHCYILSYLDNKELEVKSSFFQEIRPSYSVLRKQIRDYKLRKLLK